MRIALCSADRSPLSVGAAGMISIFSFAAPALVLCTVGLGAGALLLLPACPPPAFQGGVGWLPSAMAFSAYNMFSAVAILAPWGGRSRQGALKGNWLGLYHAFHGGRADSACPEPLSRGGRDGISHADGGHSHLPRTRHSLSFAPADRHGGHRLFLLSGWYGAALRRNRASRPGEGPPVFAVSLVAWGASLLGFGELISLIYPVFGAVSAVFLTGMAVHFAG